MEYGDCGEGGLCSWQGVVSKLGVSDEKVDPSPMLLLCGALDCFDFDKSC